MSYQETNKGTFYNPFSEKQISQFQNVYFPKSSGDIRDPDYVTQKVLFNLGFSPEDPETEFQKRLEQLDLALRIASDDLPQFFNSETDRQKVLSENRKIFAHYITGILQFKEKTGDPPILNQIRVKAEAGLISEFNSEELAALFFILEHRAKNWVDWVHQVLSTKKPAGNEKIKIPGINKIPFNYARSNRIFQIYARSIEKFSQAASPVAVIHVLGERSLKLQLFLGKLGGFPAIPFLSCSVNRAIKPPHTMNQTDQNRLWVMIFDPTEFKEAGAITLPDLNNQQHSEEREIYLLKPVLPQVCLGILPFAGLEKAGWRHIPFTNSFFEIPSGIQSAKDLLNR